jgi:hypothetical protein
MRSNVLKAMSVIAAFVAMAVLLNSPSIAVAGSEEVVEIYKDFLKSEFLNHYRDKITEDLVGGGLSEFDAEPIIEKFATEMAECFYNAMAEGAARRSIDIIEVIANPEPDGFVKLFRGPDEFDEIVDLCKYTALVNAGLETDFEMPLDPEAH